MPHVLPQQGEVGHIQFIVSRYLVMELLRFQVDLLNEELSSSKELGHKTEVSKVM